MLVWTDNNYLRLIGILYYIKYDTDEITDILWLILCILSQGMKSYKIRIFFKPI